MAKQEHEGSLEALKTLYYVLIGWSIINGIQSLADPRTYQNNSLFYLSLALFIGFLLTVIRFCQGNTLAFKYPSEGMPAIFEWWGFILQGIGFLAASYFIVNPAYFFPIFILAIFVDSIWLWVLSMVNNDFTSVYKPYCNRGAFFLVTLVFYLFLIFIYFMNLLYLSIGASAVTFVVYILIIRSLKKPEKIENICVKNEVKSELNKCYFQWLLSDFIIIPAFISLYLNNDYSWQYLLIFFAVSFIALLEDYRFGSALYSTGIFCETN